MAGIYIHIPFCRQACYYCDFHFSVNLEKQDQLVSAIRREISIQKNYLEAEPVDTIYLGGGTPSLLSREQLVSIFESLSSNFTLTPSEITLEANPDDLTREKLQSLRELGINRLSIGIQSFDDAVLKYLNRAHNAKLAIQCVEDAYSAGFDNVSIDLIYAIPGQSEDQWRSNIGKAIELRPQHVSSYSLTIEEGTVFGNRVAKGKLHPVADDATAIQMEMLADRLEREGYQHYEVSNFSEPGFESRHNSNYWRNKKYLGLGPSAHSYNGTTRQFNVSNNIQYLKSISEDTLPATIETLSNNDRINEYLLTSLRTSWGTNLGKLKDEFNYDILASHGRYVDTLLQNGLAVLSDHCVFLTRKGRLLADKIASELFV